LLGRSRIEETVAGNIVADKKRVDGPSEVLSEAAY
jgi:hypothetical protein